MNEYIAVTSERYKNIMGVPPHKNKPAHILGPAINGIVAYVHSYDTMEEAEKAAKTMNFAIKVA